MTTQSLGYDDTPIIPGTTYHVHDGNRPQPPVVTPDPIPSDAVKLFDGRDLSGWVSKKDRSPAPWRLLDDGAMEVVPGSGNIITKAEFGDCQLHLEWSAPTTVKGDGQGRGNSGVFLMGRYEIQVLDCYANPTYPDGTTGGIYGQYPPLVNACREPGAWQTFDIVWIAPRFENECVKDPARVTVIHNGILLHHDQPLQGPTEHKQLAKYVPHPAKGPLELQDHGDLVRFRNIWYRPL